MALVIQVLAWDMRMARLNRLMRSHPFSNGKTYIKINDKRTVQNIYKCNIYIPLCTVTHSQQNVPINVSIVYFKSTELHFIMQC